MLRPILILATLLWFFGATRYYVCKIKEVCPTKTEKATPEKSEEPAITVINELPISFDYNGSVAHINDHFPSYRDSIISSLSEDETLQIIGLYNSVEENTTSYENMGLARADAARKNFAPSFDAEKISISAQISETSLPQNERFSGLIFRRITNNSVQKFDDKVIINFPVASANMIQNTEVNTYLNELADYLKNAPNASVDIIGHTDNTASEEVNVQWGLKRANAIAGILRNKGVKNSQYSVSSKGESEPIANNDTRIGRQQNRRVEINIKD